MTFRIVNQACS